MTAGRFDHDHLAIGSDGRLERQHVAGGYTLEPLDEDEVRRLECIDALAAQQVVTDSGWRFRQPPLLFLCRYSDHDTRRQPIWCATGVTTDNTPIPWYVALEHDHLPPGPPWQIAVLINATSGMRITDLIRAV